MATLSDIAKRAGVSNTTVSKALNGSSDINSATRETIQAIAAELGYVPLHRKRQNDGNLIGIICPEVTSYHYSHLAEFLSKECARNGYEAILMLTGFSHERERKRFEQLSKLGICGLIFITEQPDVSDIIAHSIVGNNFPVVIISNNCPATDNDVITVDENRGICKAISQLYSSGHRNIAFIGDDSATRRLECVRYALAKYGVKLPNDMVIITDTRNETCGYEGMRRLLNRSAAARPTAVLAGSDAVALGAYRAMTEAGLELPGDISLIGFGDADFCGYLPMALSSISCNTLELCKIAARVLLSKVRNFDNKISQTVAIHSEYLSRESVGKASDRIGDVAEK